MNPFQRAALEPNESTNFSTARIGDIQQVYTLCIGRAGNLPVQLIGSQMMSPSHNWTAGKYCQSCG